MQRALWTLAVLATPVALASLLAGPGMLGRAEGCSGAGGNYWISLEWPDDDHAPTDSVIVLKGSSHHSPPLPSLTLTDPNGVNVPGTISTLSLVGYLHTAILFKPQSALAPGVTYSVDWTFPGPSGDSEGQGTLTTVADPGSKPTAPEVTASFSRLHQLTGDNAHCATSMSLANCEGGKFFATTEIATPLITLHWTYAASATSVYSLTTVQPVPGKGLAATPTAGNVQAGITGLGDFTLAFADDLPEYCVRLKTRDLTDESETLSPEICVAATGSLVPDTTPLLDSELLGCLTPPDGGVLHDEWCELHPGADGCTTPSTGTGGAIGQGAGGTSQAAGSTDSSPHASQGSARSCSLAPGRTSQPSALLFPCAGVATALFRRWARRRAR